MEWCEHHKIPAIECGGPHRVVETDLGSELLAPSEKPIGKPVSEMTEAEAQAHIEAEENAKRDS